MESVLLFLQHAFPFVFAHKNWFLFIGSAVEGLNVMILGGFLISVNSIRFLPTFLILLSGDMLNGYAWYAVGYYAGSKPIDKWGRSKPRSKKIIDKVQAYFERYSGKALVITRFTFSLTIATLIMAGSLKYNLRKFAWYNFVGAVLWVMVTLFIGYFFGQSYKFFFVYLANFTYALVFLGGAIAIVYIIKNIARSAFVKSLFIGDMIRDLSTKLRAEVDRLLSNGHDEE